MKRIGRNGGDRGNGGESSPAATAPSAAELRGDHVDSRELLKVLAAFRRGDFSVRMPAERIGLEGRIADTLNDILQLNERMTREFERINKVVGKEGKIHERANLGITAGSWSVCVERGQRLGGRPGPAFH